MSCLYRWYQCTRRHSQTGARATRGSGHTGESVRHDTEEGFGLGTCHVFTIIVLFTMQCFVE